MRVFASEADEPLAAVPTDSWASYSTHRVTPGGAGLIVRHADRHAVHRLPDGAEVGRLRPTAGNRAVTVRELATRAELLRID